MIHLKYIITSFGRKMQEDWDLRLAWAGKILVQNKTKIKKKLTKKRKIREPDVIHICNCSSLNVKGKAIRTSRSFLAPQGV